MDHSENDSNSGNNFPISGAPPPPPPPTPPPSLMYRFPQVHVGDHSENDDQNPVHFAILAPHPTGSMYRFDHPANDQNPVHFAIRALPPSGSVCRFPQVPLMGRSNQNYQNPVHFAIHAPPPSGSMNRFPQAPAMDQSANDPMYLPTVIRAPSPPRFLLPQGPANYRSINQVRLPDLVPHSDLMRIQRYHMDLFWQSQMKHMENIQATNYKDRAIPLSRMKKAMKSNKPGQMIKAESPFILSKACELFIMEITIRSWLRAENSRRRSLEKSDITNAILDSKEYGFLINKIIPDNNRLQNEGTTSQPGAS